MNIIMLGPPGSGKGTLGKRVAQKFNLKHFSSGDVIRDEIKSGTDFGKYIKEITDRGDLVPDEKITEFVLQKIEGHDGVLLDGFPRTVGQAKHLDEANFNVDHIISLEVAEDLLKTRLMNRLTCKVCHHVYNTVTQPPKVEGKCDLDGGELYQRKDQSEEVVSHRLEVYKVKTAEIVNFYKDRESFKAIDGSGTPDEVYDLIMQSLGE